jgi:predicted DNA-binding protein
MDINDLPKINKKTKLTRHISIVVSEETKTKLEYLKNHKQIDTSTVLRNLIDDFLEKVSKDI